MKLLPALTPELSAWALRQPVFFIASAPLHGQHINVSPKGLPSATLAILGPNQVAYLDRTGSGCETVAHLYENGRATLMFMSLGASPRILRLFCRGRVVEWDDPEFGVWLGRMGKVRVDAARSVVVLDVFSVTTSCGYGVPRVRREVYAAGRMGRWEDEEETIGDGDVVLDGEEGGEWKGLAELSVFEERPTLGDFARKREKAGTVLDYQVEKNCDSLDGLPGLKVARRAAGEIMFVGEAKAWARRVLAEKGGICFGFLLAVAMYLVATGLSGGISMGFPKEQFHRLMSFNKL